jgi:hypothetical protein
VVLTDTEDVEPYLVGVLDLFDQVSKTLSWAERTAGLVMCRSKTINADFHCYL